MNKELYIELVKEVLSKEIHNPITSRAIWGLGKMLNDTSYWEKVHWEGMGDSLNYAFMWSDTDEGYDFWRGIFIDDKEVEETEQMAEESLTKSVYFIGFRDGFKLDESTEYHTIDIVANCLEDALNFVKEEYCPTEITCVAKSSAELFDEVS